MSVHAGDLRGSALKVRQGACAVVVAGLVVSGAGVARADPVIVPLSSSVRACDYTLAETTWAPGYARALAYVDRTSPVQVAVDLRLQAAMPSTRYYVKVFQLPRSSSDCGVTPVGMTTDGSGSATVTVRIPLSPESTGVWVSVERPSPYSQQPAEAYASDFVVAV